MPGIVAPIAGSFRRALALTAVAMALVACEGVSLPFTATPTPEPTRRPLPTAAPTPSPTPKPTIEVEITNVALNEKAGPLFVSVAFRLRNPSATEWLYQAVATGALSTPDGRPLPQSKPTTAVDLGPGEQKWFAFPVVDTLGSIVGKAEIVVTGGQWLPAGSYPYPGGVPVTVKAAEKQRPNPPQTRDFTVTNAGELGISGSVRGYAFDVQNKLLGVIECPNRLYPARAQTIVACAAPLDSVLDAPRVTFVAYPDLRPVLVIPTPSPSPSPSPRPTASPSSSP